MLVFATGCGKAQNDAVCPTASTWTVLLQSHVTRYPAMQIPDALKLLQQATMGSEHAMRDPAEAIAWMDNEWKGLGDGPAEPLVDTLGLNGRFVRVHLRPYREAGGDPSQLVAAFVQTAQQSPHDTAGFRCALKTVTNMTARHLLPWSSDSVSGAIAQWRTKRFAALDHSPQYESAYHPAYRVIDLSLITRVFRGGLTLPNTKTLSSR